MNVLRRYWRVTKNNIQNVEDRFDQWLLKNPFALISHIRFKVTQKTSYTTSTRRLSLLLKLFAAGYLLSNLGEIDLNEYSWTEPRRVITQYQSLANYAEQDHLEQTGKEAHLQEMLGRGKQRGLSQVELFELSKYLELNESSKNVVYHVEYLRNLKS